VGSYTRKKKQEIEMTTIFKQLLTMSIVLMNISAFGAEHPQLKAFPPAKEGMQRFVITLPHKERGEEEAFKVELVAGKSMLTDGVNQVRLGSSIKPQPLKGWGYTYYEVSGSAVEMSTLMAPPEGAPKVKTFVTGTPLLIRYNSRLPIVVYAPQGYEVQYRIWQAPEIFQQAQKG
jgi:ecotin